MWTSFHDIAYLYLYLAADTDGELDAREVDAIVTLLHRRLPDRSTEDVRRIVAEVNAARGASDGPEMHRVVETLRRSALTDEQRSGLLDDLMQIARADGRVLAVEDRFIGALARAWHVDLPDDMGGAVHDLALVYLFMATGTGGRVTRAARDRVTDQLAHWQPGLATPTLRLIVQQAAHALQQGRTADRLDEAIDVIKRALPLAPQRRAVLEAVVHIARADDRLSPDEQAFFRKLTTALELE